MVWIIGHQPHQWLCGSTLGGPSLLNMGESSVISDTYQKGKYWTPHAPTDRLQWNIFQENPTLWIIGRQRHQWPRASTLGGPSLLTAGCSYYSLLYMCIQLFTQRENEVPKQGGERQDTLYYYMATFLMDRKTEFNITNVVFYLIFTILIKENSSWKVKLPNIFIGA